MANSAIVFAGQGTAQLLSAVTFIVLAREMTVGEFGTAAAVYGVSLFLSILFEFGGTNYWIRELAAPGHDGDFVAQLMLRVRMSVGLVTVMIPTVLIDPNIILVVSLGLFVAIERVATSPLRAKLLMGRLVLVVVLEKALVAGVVVASASFADPSTAILLGASTGAASFCSIVAIKIWPFQTKRADVVAVPSLRSLPRGSFNLGISSIAVAVQNLDVLLVHLVGSAFSAGIYSAVARWTLPMGLVSTAVGQSMYPDMARAQTTREARQIYKGGLAIVAISIVPIGGVAFFAPYLVSALLGPAYDSAALTLRILCGAVAMSILTSPVVSLLQARREERFTSRLLSVAIPCQMLLLTVGVTQFGANGGALAVLLTQMVLLAAAGYKAGKLVEK